VSAAFREALLELAAARRAAKEADAVYDAARLAACAANSAAAAAHARALEAMNDELEAILLNGPVA